MRLKSLKSLKSRNGQISLELVLLLLIVILSASILAYVFLNDVAESSGILSNMNILGSYSTGDVQNTTNKTVLGPLIGNVRIGACLIYDPAKPQTAYESNFIAVDTNGVAYTLNSDGLVQSNGDVQPELVANDTSIPGHTGIVYRLHNIEYFMVKPIDEATHPLPQAKYVLKLNNTNLVDEYGTNRYLATALDSDGTVDIKIYPQEGVYLYTLPHDFYGSLVFYEN
ncbi:class III signal peptide-containing protein [Methanococcus voltae]|uniref:Uncharacterized protein n=1 Tax=Methanococcus voltae (strain ATCC BAA-1334 / A3) TaxID=456320 RepID=D7DTB5_METV3|nr:class III signal peptide-containing protein [Methanococcus voltae]MCS3901226.1 uncharacterized protein (UPF0333 family) [Methanococcus voltae]